VGRGSPALHGTLMDVNIYSGDTEIYLSIRRKEFMEIVSFSFFAMYMCRCKNVSDIRKISLRNKNFSD